MPPSALSEPVGAYMRAATALEPEDSLSAAAASLRESGGALVPVAESGILSGVVTEQSLAVAIGAGAAMSQPVSDALAPICRTIAAYATGAEALRLFDTDGTPLVVIDERGQVLGLLSPSDLLGGRPQHLTPPLVGGMATPFGVYLTSGNARGGAGHAALLATGSLLFLLYFASGMLGGLVFAWTDGLLPAARLLLADLVPLAAFFGSLRVMPLASIHAAEHKVVHAIERGEELTMETVSRMPRIHPRCGTNLAVGMALFLGLGTTTWIGSEQLRLIVAGLATLMLWRPLGGFVQRYITTKPPSRIHLESGIEAGRELLANYAKSRTRAPSFGQRLVNSGLFHVMAGSILTFLALAALNAAFGLGLPIEV